MFKGSSAFCNNESRMKSSADFWYDGRALVELSESAIDVNLGLCERFRNVFISPIVKIICPCPKARLRNFVNGIHEESFVNYARSFVTKVSLVDWQVRSWQSQADVFNLDKFTANDSVNFIRLNDYIGTLYKNFGALRSLY